MIDSSPAYQLGRLFAVCEKANREINHTKENLTTPYNLHTTCRSPREVFPALLRRFTTNENRDQISEILATVKEIPLTFNTLEQSSFYLGYHHERRKP